MTTEAVQYSKEQSTDIVYKKKKRLAKSGKDKKFHENSVYPNGNFVHSTR